MSDSTNEVAAYHVFMWNKHRFAVPINANGEQLGPPFEFRNPNRTKRRGYGPGSSNTSLTEDEPTQPTQTVQLPRLPRPSSTGKNSTAAATTTTAGGGGLHATVNVEASTSARKNSSSSAAPSPEKERSFSSESTNSSPGRSTRHRLSRSVSFLDRAMAEHANKERQARQNSKQSHPPSILQKKSSFRRILPPLFDFDYEPPHTPTEQRKRRKKEEKDTKKQGEQEPGNEVDVGSKDGTKTKEEHEKDNREALKDVLPKLDKAAHPSASLPAVFATNAVKGPHTPPALHRKSDPGMRFVRGATVSAAELLAREPLSKPKEELVPLRKATVSCVKAEKSSTQATEANASQQTPRTTVLSSSSTFAEKEKEKASSRELTSSAKSAASTAALSSSSSRDPPPSPQKENLAFFRTTVESPPPDDLFRLMNYRIFSTSPSADVKVAAEEGIPQASDAKGSGTEPQLQMQETEIGAPNNANNSSNKNKKTAGDDQHHRHSSRSKHHRKKRSGKGAQTAESVTANVQTDSLEGQRKNSDNSESSGRKGGVRHSGSTGNKAEKTTKKSDAAEVKTDRVTSPLHSQATTSTSPYKKRNDTRERQQEEQQQARSNNDVDVVDDRVSPRTILNDRNSESPVPGYSPEFGEPRLNSALGVYDDDLRKASASPSGKSNADTYDLYRYDNMHDIRSQKTISTVESISPVVTPKSHNTSATTTTNTTSAATTTSTATTMTAASNTTTTNTAAAAEVQAESPTPAADLTPTSSYTYGFRLSDLTVSSTPHKDSQVFPASSSAGHTNGNNNNNNNNSNNTTNNTQRAYVTGRASNTPPVEQHVRLRPERQRRAGGHTVRKGSVLPLVATTIATTTTMARGMNPTNADMLRTRLHYNLPSRRRLPSPAPSPAGTMPPVEEPSASTPDSVQTVSSYDMSDVSFSENSSMNTSHSSASGSTYGDDNSSYGDDENDDDDGDGSERYSDDGGTSEGTAESGSEFDDATSAASSDFTSDGESYDTTTTTESPNTRGSRSTGDSSSPSPEVISTRRNSLWSSMMQRLRKPLIAKPPAEDDTLMYQINRYRGRRATDHARPYPSSHVQTMRHGAYGFSSVEMEGPVDPLQRRRRGKKDALPDAYKQNYRQWY